MVSTLAFVVRELRNWPVFLLDAAWLPRSAGTQRFIYTLRNGTRVSIRAFTGDKWVLTDIFRLWRPRARVEELVAPLTAAGFALCEHLLTPLGGYLKMRNTCAVPAAP